MSSNIVYNVMKSETDGFWSEVLCNLTEHTNRLKKRGIFLCIIVARTILTVRRRRKMKKFIKNIHYLPDGCKFSVFCSQKKMPRETQLLLLIKQPLEWLTDSLRFWILCHNRTANLVRKLLSFVTKIPSVQEQNAQLYWEFSRCLYFFGDQFDSSEREKEKELFELNDCFLKKKLKFFRFGF